MAMAGEGNVVELGRGRGQLLQRSPGLMAGEGRMSWSSWSHTWFLLQRSPGLMAGEGRLIGGLPTEGQTAATEPGPMAGEGSAVVAAREEAQAPQRSPGLMAGEGA